MTPQEANDIISEYMGGTCDNCGGFTGSFCCITRHIEYLGRLDYESLDALAPVFAKLGNDYAYYFEWAKDEWEFRITHIPTLKKHSYDYEAISGLGLLGNAAAIATAKAIKELTK